MKTVLNKCKYICFALVIALLFPSVQAYAADTYTVTFRPGNVGYFATEANPDGDRREMAMKVAESLYGDRATVTAHGAIKVTVNAGDKVPTAPTYIQAKTGYFVRDSWKPADETVDRNMDFVVDYARLVDGVEYTVKYVDSASGESIAPIYIAQANIGDERTEIAPLQIVISGGVVYYLSSASSITLVLDEDSSKNVFTFSYTMAPPGTVIDEVIIGENGQIITTTDYVTVGNAGGQATAGGNVTVAAGDAGGAAEAGGNVDAPAVDIADEETPLAGSIDNQSTDEGNALEIKDGEVPLAPGMDPIANMAMIGASVFAVAAVLVAGIWLFMKKKRALLKNESKEE
ncbi:MAG: hypothetical protein KIG50_01625 [Lachnospiraceae bacterium]|nr:hypothetical protein [Lachnospiraceae bacterium]